MKYVLKELCGIIRGIAYLVLGDKLVNCLGLLMDKLGPKYVITFLFLFSPEAGDTGGNFVDMMGCENTKHDVQNASNPAHCRVCIVHPRGRRG